MLNFGPVRRMGSARSLMAVIEQITLRRTSDLLVGALRSMHMVTALPRLYGRKAPLEALPLSFARVEVPGPARSTAALVVASELALEPRPEGAPLLRTYDPATGIRGAWIVDDPLLAGLLEGGLRPGSPAPQLDVEHRSLLTGVGALVQPDLEQARVEHMQQMISDAAASLRERRFAFVPSVLRPGHLAALARHFGEIPSSRPLEGDVLSGRLVEKDEPLAQALHVQLAPLASRVVEGAVAPTYTYTMWYKPGARLLYHTDNELCELTLNLAVDEAPSGWPIYVVSNLRQVVEIEPAPGDLVLFRGRELPHFRRALVTGAGATGVLLHYGLVEGGSSPPLSAGS